MQISSAVAFAAWLRTCALAPDVLFARTAAAGSRVALARVGARVGEALVVDLAVAVVVQPVAVLGRGQHLPGAGAVLAVGAGALASVADTCVAGDRRPGVAAVG